MGHLPFGLIAATVFASVAQGQPAIAAFDRFHRSTAEAPDHTTAGVLLLNELNCVACHLPPDTWRERLPGRGRIRLDGVGSRIDAADLRAFIAGPHAFKPGTAMPATLRDDPLAADGIAAFLAASEAPVKAFPAGDASRGQKLYNSIGCIACHASEVARDSAGLVPLVLARVYARDALAEFLQNPLHTRPGGRMPAFELADEEAADLAAYLQRDTTRLAPTRAIDATAALVEIGRKQFAARSCVVCHDLGLPVDAPPATALDRVRSDRGCLAETLSPDVPDFNLDATQRRAMRDALRVIQSGPPEVQAANEKLAATFFRLNCYACHEWRGRGGVDDGRVGLFTATDGAGESLGELGYLPPRLDSAGRKLTAEWLEKLLWGEDGGVRPYLSVRMPRIGREAAGDLVPLLIEASRPEQPLEIDVSGGKGHHRFEIGRVLLGNGAGGLGCVACHGLKQQEPTGMRTINLTHTAQRLQPEYFKALLLDPQGIQAGTIMPPLFAGRENADKEVESLWTYFKELDQSDLLPEGLAVAGSFELKPQEEGRPIVFRTFLEGAGTQAIAVGFPAGVHAAFDAFEVRWAMAWRGRFLDAQTNWEERSMKPVKPLGEPKRILPSLQPFARLRGEDDPWPTHFGSYAGYAFKGYRIAADGTPTFLYEVDELRVEDTMRAAPDGASLRRSVVVHRGSKRDGTWYFRGLHSGNVQPVRWSNDTAMFEETISF